MTNLPKVTDVEPIEITKLLQYEPETGDFYWKVSLNHKIKENKKAGTLTALGYIVIGYKGVYYKAHRLAWLMTHGSWPIKDIDHIDGIRNNNKIENLREVSRRINCQNKVEHRKGFLYGVTYRKDTNKWSARIRIKETVKYLGCFNSELEAHEAYRQAMENLNE